MDRIFKKKWYLVSFEIIEDSCFYFFVFIIYKKYKKNIFHD